MSTGACAVAMNPPHSGAFPAALRPSAGRVSYASGATVFRTGSPTHSVFYVATGAVRLPRYGRQGEETVLHDARPGEFFAEASLDSARYHGEAVASEPSELLQMPAAALGDLLDGDRKFARQWVALLARQLRAVRTRVERLSLKSAAERVLHLLVSEGRGAPCEFVLVGTLKDLARNLGLTYEVLYRTLAAMEREGVIERGDDVLRLVQ
jgi:CRP/FNR family transcriptional regulator, dissimilatory nitrate respiration regulator